MQGKVALITGGGAGIGQATAFAFANKGVKVAIADINVQGSEKTVRLIKDGGGEAVFIEANVAKEDDIKAMVDGAVAAFGRLDYGINNAGIGGTAVSLHETDLQTWNKIIAVNLTGTFNCMKYEIKQMLAQGGGAIVNVSSIGGLRGTAGLYPYTASKHGVTGLTRSAALEYSAQGIRINSVHPGAIRTEALAGFIEKVPQMGEAIAAMHPIGRIGEPKEVADAIVWLCSDEASFVTGHAMVIDGASIVGTKTP
ncbi:MAG: glucose 1-dehydrogenase [Chloroflexota bacterium]